MDKYVAALNIEHLRKQVSEERDVAKCEILRRLLAEEEATMASILARPKQTHGVG